MEEEPATAVQRHVRLAVATATAVRSTTTATAHVSERGRVAEARGDVHVVRAVHARASRGRRLPAAAAAADVAPRQHLFRRRRQRRRRPPDAGRRQQRTSPSPPEPAARQGGQPQRAVRPPPVRVAVQLDGHHRTPRARHQDRVRESRMVGRAQ